MDFRKWLIEALGLDSTADDAAIQAALKAKIGGNAEVEVESALQSALAPIGTALGLSGDVTAATVLAGVQQLKDGHGDSAVIAALQSELAGVTTRLNTLVADGTKAKATAFVDGAIAAGRVGVKPMRDRYISMHMADAAGTEALVNAMPLLTGGALLLGDPAEAKPGELTAEQRSVVSLMGIDPEAYKKTLAEAGIKETL